VAKTNFNGLAKWAAILIALAAIAYNAIDTKAILKNDVKHIQSDIVEIKQDVRELRTFIIDKEK